MVGYQLQVPVETSRHGSVHKGEQPQVVPLQIWVLLQPVLEDVSARVADPLVEDIKNVPTVPSSLLLLLLLVAVDKLHVSCQQHQRVLQLPLRHGEGVL